MAGNPWVDEKGDDFKKEVLIELDHLNIKFVNGEEGEVTQEDKDDAKAEKEQRIKDAQEAAEEAARLAAEKAENPDEDQADEWEYFVRLYFSIRQITNACKL